MKKSIFLFVLVGLIMFVAQALNAPTDYSVAFEWDDSNCSECNSVTKYAKVKIYTYPGNVFVCESDWEVVTGYQGIIYDSGDIRTDCESDCYLVYVSVKYVDNEEICCQGTESETCTGQQLYSGFTLTTTIILY